MVGLFMELEAVLEVMFWRNTSLKVNRLPCLFNLVWLHAMTNGSVTILLKKFYFNFCSLFMQTAVHGSAAVSKGEQVWSTAFTSGTDVEKPAQNILIFGKKLLKHKKIEQMSK